VVVLGFWAASQKRISFAQYLGRLYSMKTRTAKALLDAHLESGLPIVMPVAPSSAPEKIAARVANYGATTTIVSSALFGFEWRPNWSPANEARLALRSVAEELLAEVDRPRGFAVIDEVAARYVAARAGTASLRCDFHSQATSKWTGPFDLPRSLVELYDEWGPHEIELGTLGNPFRWPSLARLWEYQAGYRWNANTREPVTDWDQDHLVVADHGADPFVLSIRTGRVLFALHGQGVWEFDEFCADVATLGAILTTISTTEATFDRNAPDTAEERERQIRVLEKELAYVVRDGRRLLELLGFC
jgi:hypothetical protein